MGPLFQYRIPQTKKRNTGEVYSFLLFDWSGKDIPSKLMSCRFNNINKPENLSFTTREIDKNSFPFHEASSSMERNSSGFFELKTFHLNNEKQRNTPKKEKKNIWLDQPHLALFPGKIKNKSLLIYSSPDLKKGNPVQVFQFLKFKHQNPWLLEVPNQQPPFS